MSGEPVYLKVFRYDPGADGEPRYENYEVPWREGLLLLCALKYVRDNLDDTLAFRDYCCGCSWCMSCVMTVNGKGMRTCSRPVKPGEHLMLEPMKGFPVIRDLAVDFGVTITTPEGIFRKTTGTVIRRLRKARSPESSPVPVERLDDEDL
jgi:succinate dehydrogenase/fumarate reductase-like Fe-S protein